MRTILSYGLLLAALAAFTFPGAPPAVAQKKDKDIKKGAVIEVNQSAKDSMFRFTIRNASGKGLAQSLPPRGFATEKEALKAVDELKDVLKVAKVVVKRATVKPAK